MINLWRRGKVTACAMAPGLTVTSRPSGLLGGMLDGRAIPTDMKKYRLPRIAFVVREDDDTTIIDTPHSLSLQHLRTGVTGTRCRWETFVSMFQNSPVFAASSPETEIDFCPAWS